MRTHQDLLADLDRQLANAEEMSKEIGMLKRRSALQRSFAETAFLYFVSNDRSPRTTISTESVQCDSDPDWVDGLFNSPKMHEPEFVIFRHFQDQNETILDIGANWGYSVASIWASGSRSSILSFEPNPMHHECLERVKELWPGRFDFVASALGSEDAELNFIIPVIDGKAIHGLTSSVLKDGIAWAVFENLVAVAIQHCAQSEPPELRFLEANWNVSRLDDILGSRRFAIPSSKIVAMKINVEGMEGAVLAGGSSTLSTHKPLIMLEGANRSRNVAELMSARGFNYAEFNDGTLELSDRPSLRVNGFFVHKESIAEFRKIGLLG